MIAAVTGATGFLGSHLADALIARGCTVRSLHRKSSNLRWVKDTPIELIEGDLRSPDALKRLVQGADLVFHVAGVVKARTLEDYTAGNETATRNMLEAVRQYAPDCRRFLHVSSGTVGGPAPSLDRPIREDDPPNPLTRYGITKAAAEAAVKEYTGILPWTIVRPPAMYGPRDTEILVYFKTFAGGLNTMMGFNEKHVSLLHSTDLVNGILLAADSDKAVGQTYNISSEHFYTWPQVGRVTGEVLGRRGLSIRIPHSVVFAVAAVAQLMGAIQRKAVTLNIEKARDITQQYWIFDVTKARNDLGYRQTISLEDGIRSTIEWYKKQGWL